MRVVGNSQVGRTSENLMVSGYAITLATYCVPLGLEYDKTQDETTDVHIDHGMVTVHSASSRSR